MTTNPALQDLDALVGDWRMELANADVLAPGPSMTGMVSVSWLDDSFLVLPRAALAARGAGILLGPLLLRHGRVGDEGAGIGRRTTPA